MAKLFLDSGAFSAYQNKTSIDIENYIQFIKEHKDEIEVYANLDSIGSAEETWKNQKAIEAAGLNPIPVYHLDEPSKYLDMCMEYPYFAVGGLASAKGRSLAPFLQTVFEKICTEKSDYFPTHKVHGFGIATPEIINMFPWYSIDSTSWVQYGRYGIILVPRIKYGEFRYDFPPYTIAISSRSKSIKDAEHFKNLSSMEKNWIINYCEIRGFKIGRTLYKQVNSDYVLKNNEHWFDRKDKSRVEVIVEDGLCTNGELRDSLNLMYFLELTQSQPKYPWRWSAKKSIFD